MTLLAVGCGGESDTGEEGGTPQETAGTTGDAGKGSAGKGGGTAGAGGGAQGGNAQGGAGQAGSSQAGNTSAGTGNAAGASAAGSAGAAQGGAAQGGEGGSAQAGSAQAGSSQAGSGQGGAGSGQAGQGGGTAGSGEAGSGQAGSGQAGSAQGGSAQGGAGSGSGGAAGGCCKSDVDCAGPDPIAQVCVNGQCVAAPSKGACWSDADCDKNFFCADEFVCACGALCGAQENKPGKCVAVGDGCCKTDDECIMQGLSQCVQNVCKPALKAGQCWDVSDCGANQLCQGAAACPCGFDCIQDSPGLCVDAGGCCTTDDECAKADPKRPVCVSGVCEVAPGTNQCWSSADCGGAACNGVQVCPCGADCIPNNQVGTCEAPIGGCCQSDDECIKQGLTQCVNTICVGAPAPGACWDDGDCGNGSTCEGEFICPCNAKCIQPSSPGKCATVSDGCCKQDADCGLGAECVNNVCKKLPAPGECWDNGDCGSSGVCQGESVCPCGAACLLPDSPGKCASVDPGSQCCKSDLDCGKGFECVNQVCKALPAAGTCWDDGDCGPGAVCQGESVCVCGALCLLPDKPGNCASVNPDNCCKSDLDCGKGFECVSNVCKALPPAGACWDDGDCSSGALCQGESVCPCGAACLLPDSPGKCEGGGVDPGGCCKQDADCGFAAQCVGASANQNGVCKPLGTLAACWDDGDCKIGMTCQGESVCPCGAACLLPDKAGACK